MHTNTEADDESAARALRSKRRWRAVMRVCQASLAMLIGVGVWSIGFAGDGDVAPILPDTDEQFSLDLSVIDTTDHPLIYAVEQRARPAYRIFSFDPNTGADETVYTVPEDAIIFGIALDDEQATLAVTYSPDFALNGSGLALLDLDTGELSTVLPVETDVYFTDPVWSDDSTSVFATRVDRRGEGEELDVARIDVNGSTPGAVDIVITDAINPVDTGDGIAHLAVDADGARRSVRSTGSEPGGSALVSGELDLDHLVIDDDGELWVAALDETDEPAAVAGLVFGQSASAHGNHDRPSTWWDLDSTSDVPTPSSAEPIIVYDAVIGDEAIVAATNEGVSIIHLRHGSDQQRLDLIASRAIRFVAA